ncbi:MAG: hypothetical protein JSV17_03410, partial [Candidatus Aminicenantes bacterium]
MKNISWKLWIFVAVVAVAMVMFGTACATSDRGQEKSATPTEETLTQSDEVEHTHDQEGEHVHEQGEGDHTHAEEGEQTHTHDEEVEHTLGEETHTHGEEGEHTHGQEGEESEEKLAITDTYDQVRKGVRLVLAYHNASSSFIGT